MKTGKPVYHQCRLGGEDDMQWIRASASMPIVSRPVRIGEYYLSDGGSADSVPVHYFESIGYTRQVIILTRPLEYKKKPYSHSKIIKLALLRYPALASALMNRWQQYNQTIDYINQKEKTGEFLVIRPAQPLPVGHTSHNAEQLKLTYEIGRTDGKKSIRRITEFLCQ
jgi:predicted patatin/cPLA2 family phospholipase